MAGNQTKQKYRVRVTSNPDIRICTKCFKITIKRYRKTWRKWKFQVSIEQSVEGNDIFIQ